MRQGIVIAGFVIVAIVVGTCVGCSDDDEALRTVQIAAYDYDDGDDRNEHRDCENNTGECSDDDQVVFAPVICLPDSTCEFG